ncbi:MAG TPA: hypothetical protein VEL76_14360 [Gemmataceae bacterium]|nr:hypothetical protein [Gemmataceae bacterium]
MRLCLCLLAVGLLLWPPAPVSAQEGEARAVIEKAVKALGGLDKLDRKAAAHRKSKGIFHTDGFTFTGESFSEPGGRRRITLRGTVKEAHQTRTLVMDGDKGWMSYDGDTFDLDAAFIDRIKKSAYADRVCGLVTLLKDKGYTLSPLGESQIKGTTVLGVRVQSEGKPDVSLYFDKETSLLVKSANRTTEPNSDREVLQEVYYHDYRLYDPTAADEQLLKAAKRGVEGPALLALLRERIPSEDDQAKMRELILKLGHKSFSVRQRATVALQELGAKPAALLRQAARESDLEVSRRATQCLEKIADDPDQALVAAAVRLMAVRRPAGAAEALLAYGPWAPDETIAREVQGALAAVAVEGGKKNPVLVQALKDRDPQRRALAAAALGEDGGAYLKQGWRRLHVEGVRMAMRSALYRDGVHFMDLESLGVEFFNRLDDSLFVRP